MCALGRHFAAEKPSDNQQDSPFFASLGSGRGYGDEDSTASSSLERGRLQPLGAGRAPLSHARYSLKARADGRPRS